MNEDKEKYDIFFQDFGLNDKTVLYKIFKYFYSLSHEQNELNSFLIYILIIIETIQLMSYAFTSPHLTSWKMEERDIKLISNIFGVFRLTPLMKFLHYKIYLFIFFLLVAIIFLFFILVFVEILFSNPNSKISHFFSKLIHYMIEVISTVLYIPIIEIVLIPIKCINGYVYGPIDSEKCWESMHYLNMALGVIGAILLLIISIFVMNFKFYPFQKSMSATRINSNNDIIFIIMKVFAILQNIFISNEYISLFIMLLVSIIIFFNCFNNKTYNNFRLELFINIKNLIIIWTYFVLLVSKIQKNYIANGLIYLLFFGCPIIIIFSIAIYKDRDYKFSYLSTKRYNANEYIEKAKYNIKLIDSFLERLINFRSENEEERERNIIILKGNINLHNKTCTNKDCPLTKFNNNEGNYNVQKQCLLNYMNIFFNQGLKRFPDNFDLLILYIYFNYNKKFNLNSVRTHFIQLKKLRCTIKQNYIIFCIEQNIKNMKNNIDININNDKDNESQADMTEQKYMKLKYLIENSIKLYDEFWGIFSTTITNNINTNKLYLVGEKLNKYLTEINNLWENDLKNRRINNDFKNIVQLYCNFLVELLWDQKKSKEIYKKLNDENLNSYNTNDNKNREDNGEGLDSLLNNQDFWLYYDYDEKGNSKIVQCTYSFCHYLGYQKFHIIGKPLEMIMPNLLFQNYSTYIDECIKSVHNGQNTQNDLSLRENDSNKNSKLIMIKNRMGYIFPFFSSLTVSNDNDYSDSFLIKTKLENRDAKSEYSYSILTNNEFAIENISSSSIHLGLTLDLLKKYVVKMDILVRTDDDQELNLVEGYNEFEEEPKVVCWVFPDLIYPKDDINHVNEDEIEGLIEKSHKKKIKLQIKTIKFNSEENLGFAFKFSEIASKSKRKKKFKEESCIPKSDKNLILFDLLQLNYIRGLIVNKKSVNGLMRSIEEDEGEESKFNSGANNQNNDKTKKKKKSKFVEMESSDEELDNDINILTKEKIGELQVHNFESIKNFIFSLPLYASDIALERFRPNGEKYSASKMTESLLKINVTKFIKRMNEKYKVDQMIKKKKIKNSNNDNSTASLNSPKSSNTDNNLVSADTTNSSSSTASTDSQREEMNKGIASDSSSSLSNVFTSYSIKYLGLLMLVNFSLFIILVTLEFIVKYRHINKIIMKIDFLHSGYTLSNVLVYTKFFITEGVISNTLNQSGVIYEPVIQSGYENFTKSIQGELTFYRQEFTETFDVFTSNQLSHEFKNYLSQTKLNIYTLTVNIINEIEIIFNSAMTRIPSSINELSIDPTMWSMNNRDTYELMYNLLNEYFINWEKLVEILLQDCFKATKYYFPVLIISISLILVSIAIFIFFIKFLMIFLIERERPINLFLTLKKKVFESLKNAAESFSNKILNKIFGNEDVEEESQQDYQTNIEPNDINIVKFKAINNTFSSFKNVYLLIEIIIMFILFLMVFVVSSIILYCDFRNRMNQINDFIILFGKLNVAQKELILSLDIFKSYLFNKSIPILNENNTQPYFVKSFTDISERFEQLFIYSSQTRSFLNDEDYDKYKQYLYRDISDLLEKGFYERNADKYKLTFEKGIILSQYKLFENIRSLFLKYNINNNTRNDENIAILLEENDSTWHMINYSVQSLIRYWYDGVIKLMTEALYHYQDKSKMFYIIFFICLIIIDLLAYMFLWRYYEQKLYLLLKRSIDLINLLPQEIKNIIIEKLNE